MIRSSIFMFSIGIKLNLVDCMFLEYEIGFSFC